MAYNVKFMRGTQANYDALTTKSADTLYFITDANAERFYLGTQKIADAKALADVITESGTSTSDVSKLKAAMAGIDYTKNENPDTIASYIAEEIKEVTDDIGDLATLTTTAKSTIVGAINELDSDLGTLTTNSAITVESDTSVTGVLKRYTIKQGGTAVTGGVIDIPKDLFVESGSVVQVVQDGTDFKIGNDVITNAVVDAAGTYIRLVLQNQAEPLFIKASSLVDVYTVAANATQVQLAISNNELSATIVAGSVTATELASDAVTTAKILDENVTKAKLASAVQTSLGKADSAVQSVAEGSTNGTVAVDGTDVAVHGLGTAAYTASSAYDAAGAASAVQTAVVGESTDAASADTINGLRNYVDAGLSWASIPAATPAEPSGD